MALWTNAGLTLVATAVQTSGANVAITYVGIGTGCGTLFSGLSSGTVYTSLALDAGLPAALASSQQLTITDGTNSQTVTVASGGAAQGATSIPVNSFTASYTFAAHTTGVCPTPLATDLALYNETQRVASTGAAAGSNPGESFVGGYFDGTQPSGIYLQVGFFGGSTATGTTSTGTLMAADIQFWNHSINVDTNYFQADGTI